MSAQLVEQRGLFPLDQIQVDFEKFDRDNPHVYQLICKLARQAKARGFKRYSMDVIVAIIRWHHDIETRSEQAWKMNDHFVSRYSRKLMDEFPEFKGFFELRVLSFERKK